MRLEILGQFKKERYFIGSPKIIRQAFATSSHSGVRWAKWMVNMGKFFPHPCGNSGLNSVPQIHVHSESYLEMGSLYMLLVQRRSYWIRVGPNPIIGVLIRSDTETEGQMQRGIRKTQRMPCDGGGKDGSEAATSQRTPRTASARGWERGLPSGTPKKGPTLQTPGSWTFGLLIVRE